MNVVKKAAKENGDVVTWKLEIENPTTLTCRDVKVVFTIPDGVSLTGPSDVGYIEILVPQGAYDRSTDTWWVGILEAGAKREVILEFTVDDVTKADTLTGYFEIKALLDTACTDSNSSDDLSELVIAIGTDCVSGTLTIGEGTESNVDLSIG